MRVRVAKLKRVRHIDQCNVIFQLCLQGFFFLFIFIYLLQTISALLVNGVHFALAEAKP